MRAFTEKKAIHEMNCNPSILFEGVLEIKGVNVTFELHALNIDRLCIDYRILISQLYANFEYAIA